MSFFKRLVPVKADLNLVLQSLTVENGQPFKGTASLISRDNFNVEEVRMEIRINENWQEPVWERDSNGNQRQVIKKQEAVLYSQDVPVSQPFEMHNGDKRDFPFEVTIPMQAPSRYGGAVTYSLKGVANVKGRPDVTKSVSPMVMPASVSSGVAAQATQVIQKEVVKVPCEYCGTLVELTSGVNKCPGCGAPIKLS